ncbi:MAG: ribonuclease P protein component [Nitrospinota bacterium]|nr:ribonuclease P protein component [Nitrospinota bacterium]
MAAHSFRKSEKLLKYPEFKKILDKGRKKKVGAACMVFWNENPLGRNRCGIIASKKIGPAVARNRAKRKIREVFRLNKHKVGPTLDIVIIAGKESVNLPFSVLEKKIMQAFQA